jgi:hypothetical protein
MSDTSGASDVHPSSRIAEEIDAGGRAISRVADPRIFSGVMSILLIAFLAVMLMWQRQDQQLEREGFVTAIRENTVAVREFTSAVRDHERDATARANMEHRR